MDKRIQLIEADIKEFEEKLEYLKTLRNRIINGDNVGSSDEDLIPDDLFDGIVNTRLHNSYYFLEAKPHDEEISAGVWQPIVNFEEKSIVQTDNIQLEFNGHLLRGGNLIIRYKSKTIECQYKFEYPNLEILFNEIITLKIKGVRLENVEFMVKKYEQTISDHLDYL